MALHVLNINELTIDFIEIHNGGLRPSEENFEEPTFFIYSDDPSDDHFNEILSKADFRSKYKFKDEQSDDNIVIKK